MEVTKIIDLISGKKVSEYYKEYLETQWYDKDKMADYQLDKLRKLVRHCYANVPYYTRIMKSQDIDPNAVHSLDYVKQFPILTKEIIKANYDLFTPINLNNIKGVKTSQTGGTTGNILNKRNDAQTRSSVWGTYRRFYDWMGVLPNDKVFTYWGGHVVKHDLRTSFAKYVSDKLKNTISFDAYDTRPETFDLIVRTLRKGNIKLIRSYPQALYALALKLKETGISVSVKAIMTTSEPLMPQQRTLFKEIFNSKSFDQYGCGEIGAIAYECEAHNGLHVSDERVILETNEKDELLITDLDNFAMPYIRYWNADQAIFSDHECKCGRKSRVIEKVLGRTCDYLVGINGQSLHWAYFWHLLFDTEIAINRNFVKFQIVQKSSDCLLFRTVSDPLSDEDKSTLISMIRNKMGDMQVEFVLEKDIENTASGKFRPVINELLSNYIRIPNK